MNVVNLVTRQGGESKTSGEVLCGGTEEVEHGKEEGAGGCAEAGTEGVEGSGKMKAYEYIRLEFDINDFKGLNGLSSTGWRVVAVIDERVTGRMNYLAHYALMERELPWKISPDEASNEFKDQYGDVTMTGLVLKELRRWAVNEVVVAPYANLGERIRDVMSGKVKP